MATTNLQLGKTVVVGLDMRSGRRVKDEGGEYIVRRLSDKHNPQSSEVFEVWDYRQEPDREKGKTAILEEVSSERMILRPAPPGKEGELKLVVASYTTEGEWGSLSPRGDPHWSVHLPSLASSVRRLAGGKVLAI